MVIACEEEAARLLGGRRNFYSLVSYYNRRLEEDYGGSLDAMVAGLFPSLSPGVATSAMHALIHLGYGFAARYNRMVCEGFAYLHHSYTPIVLRKAENPLHEPRPGTLPILGVLELVAQDAELARFAQIEGDKRKSWKTSYFQRRMAPLVKERGDGLMKYASQIRWPVRLTERNFIDTDTKASMMKWLIDSCVTIYSATKKPNYFFLLHLVTSSWSLTQLLHAVDSQFLSPILRNFLCMMIATYVIEGCPAVDLSTLRNVCFSDNILEDERQRVLKNIARKDEHAYKLLQVCTEMAHKNTDPEMENIYRLAIHQVTTYPYMFNT